MGRDFTVLKSHKGFTIPELLVVIFIITLITGILLPNWRAGQDTLALNRMASQVAQNVRKAIEFSIRGEPYNQGSNLCKPPGPENKITGYGVYFTSSTPDSYLMFTDCDGNNTYDGTATDDIVETFTLPQDVRIQSVSPDPFSFFIVPPEPAMFLNNLNSPTAFPATVVLESRSDTSNTRTLKINFRGVISIE